MIDLKPPVRRTTAADAAVPAEFIHMAGDGPPLYLRWQIAGDSDEWVLPVKPLCAPRTSRFFQRGRQDRKLRGGRAYNGRVGLTMA